MADHPYTPPSQNGDAYNCPHCHAYAAQRLGHLMWNQIFSGFYADQCSRCNAFTIWIGENMVFPRIVAVEDAHVDMPDACKADFEEARLIFNESPRGAAALLRLALQKLMIHLTLPGKNINDDIKELVKAGLPPEIQQALDVCRVVGNNAVHPGELDLDATPEMAKALFGLLNLIVDDRVSKPKRVAALFASLPVGALQAIEKRDGPTA